MTKRRTVLPDHERVNILNYLLSLSHDGQLPYGAQRLACEIFRVNKSVISRIWKNKEDVSLKRKGRCGRKERDIEAIKIAIKDVPVQDRCSLRKLSAATGIPKSTLHLKLKQGHLKIASNRILEETV